MLKRDEEGREGHYIMNDPNPSETTVRHVADLKAAHERIVAELGRVIVGQKDVIEQILIGMLCRGHCLLEGMPGLAKTAMIRTLAQLLDLKFQRIQFTPDLMPADIIGTEVIEDDGSGRRGVQGDARRGTGPRL